MAAASTIPAVGAALEAADAAVQIANAYTKYKVRSEMKTFQQHSILIIIETLYQKKYEDTQTIHLKHNYSQKVFEQYRERAICNTVNSRPNGF